MKINMSFVYIPYVPIPSSCGMPYERSESAKSDALASGRIGTLPRWGERTNGGVIPYFINQMNIPIQL